MVLAMTQETPQTTPSLQEQLQFRVSLLRLVYQGSLDGGARVSSQIAEIEQLLVKK